VADFFTPLAWYGAYSRTGVCVMPIYKETPRPIGTLVSDRPTTNYYYAITGGGGGNGDETQKRTKLKDCCPFSELSSAKKSVGAPGMPAAACLTVPSALRSILCDRAVTRVLVAAPRDKCTARRWWVEGGGRTCTRDCWLS
jgi:hypothetical protein